MCKIKNKKKTTMTISSVDKAVLETASAFMCGRKTPLAEIDDSNFEEFAIKLREHKLLPIASFVISDESAISKSTLIKLKNEAFAQIIFQENRNSSFLKVYKSMINAGARPVCIKGCICEAVWSEKSVRISGDADIIASEKDFAVCRKALESSGYVPEDNGYSNEIGFNNKHNGSRIELHSLPFADESFAAGFNSAVGDLTSNCGSAVVDGVEVICPDVQQHLVYLVLHAIKHFIVAGVGIRQLMDIAFFAQKENIDWNKVFEKCSSVSADGFLSAVLLICGKYFGVDISGMDSPLFNRSVDCEILLDDILRGGIYGPRDKDKLRSSQLTVNSYSKSQNNEHHSVIFIPFRRMKKRYPYLKKFPFLLPFAWIQRIIGYAFSKHNISDTFSVGKSRIDLMKYYGIIK